MSIVEWGKRPVRHRLQRVIHKSRDVDKVRHGCAEPDGWGIGLGCGRADERRRFGGERVAG